MLDSTGGVYQLLSSDRHVRLPPLAKNIFRKCEVNYVVVVNEILPLQTFMHTYILEQRDNKQKFFFKANIFEWRYNKGSKMVAFHFTNKMP